MKLAEKSSIICDPRSHHTRLARVEPCGATIIEALRNRSIRPLEGSLDAKYKKLIDRQICPPDALLLAGVFTTMRIAGLVANGLFIQSLVVRFFTPSGALFAPAKRYGEGESA